MLLSPSNIRATTLALVGLLLALDFSFSAKVIPLQGPDVSTVIPSPRLVEVAPTQFLSFSPQRRQLQDDDGGSSSNSAALSAADASTTTNHSSSITLNYHDDSEYSSLPGDAHGIPGCDSSVTTGYIDTIGSFGLMFDIASAVPVVIDDESGGNKTSMAQDLEVFGMDVYIRNFVRTAIEIYARIDDQGNYMSYAHVEGQTKIEDNWELVAKGALEGKGPGVGSPVPQEAWLKRLVLKPGQVIGLYVTVLNGPDLRYRNSSLPEGSVLATDGLLNVGVGRSWGEYPLHGDGSDVSFHPREFSGTLHYHAHEAVCRSIPPSLAPTKSPAPSLNIANVYQDEEGMCPSENELPTSFQDGTGSYCVLFDVSPKTDLTVTGMDLNVGVY
jgi:hypothetical protein